jgi:hypothetical protein
MVASSWNRGEPGEAPEAGIPDAIAGENPGADPPAGGGRHVMVARWPRGYAGIPEPPARRQLAGDHGQRRGSARPGQDAATASEPAADDYIAEPFLARG